MANWLEHLRPFHNSQISRLSSSRWGGWNLCGVSCGEFSRRVAGQMSLVWSPPVCNQQRVWRKYRSISVCVVCPARRFQIYCPCAALRLHWEFCELSQTAQSNVFRLRGWWNPVKWFLLTPPSWRSLSGFHSPLHPTAFWVSWSGPTTTGLGCDRGALRFSRLYYWAAQLFDAMVRPAPAPRCCRCANRHR